MKFGELWKNVEISLYLPGQHFSMKKLYFSEWAQIWYACLWWWFHLMKFGELWKNVEISLHLPGQHFSMKKLTSLNGLKFDMHVSDDDNNMFCKFDEIGELWKNVEISWYYKGPALSPFFCEKIEILWKGSNFTCMFLMMIPICSASLMKFGELWKNLKFHDMIKGRHCQHFSVKKFNFSEKAQISHACFWWWFQYVLQVWWNLVNFEKMLKFHDIIKGRHCHHFSVKKFNFSEKAQISHACFW